MPSVSTSWVLKVSLSLYGTYNHVGKGPWLLVMNCRISPFSHASLSLYGLVSECGVAIYKLYSLVGAYVCELGRSSRSSRRLTAFQEACTTLRELLVATICLRPRVAVCSWKSRSHRTSCSRLGAKVVVNNNTVLGISTVISRPSRGRSSMRFVALIRSARSWWHDAVTSAIADAAPGRRVEPRFRDFEMQT